MGDTAGQRADGLHPLSLLQLGFEYFFLGDVPVDGNKRNDFSRSVENRRYFGFKNAKGIVFYSIGDVSGPDIAPGNHFPHFFVKSFVVLVASEDSKILSDDLSP